MNEVGDCRPLPSHRQRLLEQLADVLGVGRFIVFGGAALDLLCSPARPQKDIDIALPLDGPGIPARLIHLQTRLGLPISPLRPYFINLDQPVLMVEHSWRDHVLDINFVDEVERIPQFDIESIQWRFPERDYVDLYGAFNALFAACVKPVWGVDRNNPILLLNRLLRLAAKYGLLLAGEPKHRRLIAALQERIDCWEETDDFHGRQAKEAHFRTVPAVVARAENSWAYVAELARSRALEKTIPELQRLLDRGPEAWDQMSRLSPQTFWSQIISLMPAADGAALADSLHKAQPSRATPAR